MVTTAPVPRTAIRAPVESATKLVVGTVSARAIWLAPSIANVTPMIAVRIVTTRRWPGFASLAAVSGRSEFSLATFSATSGRRGRPSATEAKAAIPIVPVTAPRRGLIASGSPPVIA